jgi:GNAT superfamily N-acetyltransferase
MTITASQDTLAVGPLTDADRAAWERLARGYHEFYRESVADEKYERTWRRLRVAEEIVGFGAYLDGRLVGIVHFLFHANIWREDVCYLQDLFVDAECRGRGVGGALIHAVEAAARERGAFRVYWMTQETNAVARRLYDRVAKFSGFIRYEDQL